MKSTRQIIVLLALGVLLIGGCAKPPAEQIEAAEKAVRDAQQGGAATYVAEEYAKLEGNLAALKKEVSDQDGKFALFRDYSKAEQLAASAKAEGERVKAEAAKKEGRSQDRRFAGPAGCAGSSEVRPGAGGEGAGREGSCSTRSDQD
jgi:hypothetical protein